MSSQRAEIDIARRLASRAFDLQPWETPVDGLIDCRARVDGDAVRPHLLIPALTGEVVGFHCGPCAGAPLGTLVSTTIGEPGDCV